MRLLLPNNRGERKRERERRREKKGTKKDLELNSNLQI